MSPVDVEEFRTNILEAGTRLASLLTVEYPDADLVSAALYNVSEAVEDFSMKGKWVTSWASSAKKTCEPCVSNSKFSLDYLAGGVHLRGEIVSLQQG